MRDGGSRYGGKGVMKAVSNVRGEIASCITGMDVSDQASVDKAMIELDGTPNKSRLGANAIIAVSLAVARAGAGAEMVPLYEHIGNDGRTLPVPMLNIINGGKHAGGNLKIQEFMIIPAGAKTFSDCLRMSSEVYMSLKSMLGKRYGASSVNLGMKAASPALSTSADHGRDIGCDIRRGLCPKDVFMALMRLPANSSPTAYMRLTA